MNIEFMQTSYLAVLFSKHPSVELYTTVFILNSILSILFGIIFLSCIPRRFQKSELFLFFLFLAWSIFIPIFGVIILLIGIYFIRFYARYYHPVEIVTSTQKQFGSEKFAKLSSYAAGWAHTRIFNQTFSKEDRERALYAINKQRTQQINDINRALLDDNAYEIRLYAFNILNKQQTHITNAIKNDLDLKERTNNKIELARINKSLAYLYWEYALMNATLFELFNEMLKKAYDCAVSAIDVFPTDSNLQLLLAKIFKLSNKLDEYQKALEMISQFEYVPAEVYFNLAALSYERRDYEQVRVYLKHVGFYHISNNASLIKFWCRDE